MESNFDPGFPTPAGINDYNDNINGNEIISLGAEAANYYAKTIRFFETSECKYYMDHILSKQIKDLESFYELILREQMMLLVLIQRDKTSINIKPKRELRVYEQLNILAMSCLYFLSNLMQIGKSGLLSQSEIVNGNKELFIKKNKDYGNSFEDFGLIGILVRINDKINRLKTLMIQKTSNIHFKPEIHDESIEDTINDMYNYCVIGLIYKLV